MKHLVIAALLAPLAACATVEPEPCTAEWMDWKSDTVLTPFARDHRATISDLRNFSQKLEDPGPFTLMRVAAKLDDFKLLADDFQTNLMPELSAAVDQCGAVEFVPVFTGFLREQGVEGEMLTWIEALGMVAAAQGES